MSSKPLHTVRMRRHLLAILKSGDPAVTPAERAAAALALDDPGSLSDNAVAELAEALARSEAGLSRELDDQEHPDSAS